MNAWHALVANDYIGNMIGSVNGMIAIGAEDRIGRGDSIDLLGKCLECRGTGTSDEIDAETGETWPCVNCQGMRGFHRAYGRITRSYDVYGENMETPNLPHFQVRGDEVWYISTHRAPETPEGDPIEDRRERELHLDGVTVGGQVIHVSHVTEYDEEDQRPALDIDPEMLLVTL